MRHGFLLIDKPKGPTSHDCVSKVRSALGERKVGHLGTLDPMATGLLVLAVGAKALKVVELFNELSKEYTADVCFGAVSSTYDGEGTVEKVILKPGQAEPVQTDVQNAIADYFVGKIDQEPPAYSAIKVGGERAYRKMRQGKGVDLPSREVEVSVCDVLSYNYPNLKLHVACSSGTYIRSLAHDLGKTLRCGGYLKGLRRTKVGEWSIDHAVPLDAAMWSKVIPLKEVMQNQPRIDLTADQMEDIGHGRNIDVQMKPDTIAWYDDLPVAILVPARDGTGLAHARKVL